MFRWSAEMQRKVATRPGESVEQSPSGANPDQTPGSSGQRLPPPAVMERMEAITKRYVDCFTSAMQAVEG